VTTLPTSIPLLASARPRFEGSNQEFGEFVATGPRLLLVGTWGPLFQLLAGKLRLQGGQLTIAGHDAEGAVAAGRIGLSLADAPLPPNWSLIEVLRQSALLLGWSRRDAAERSKAALRDAGLERQASTPLGRLGAGERRAASLLAAALGEPAVLAIETPLEGLEPSARAFVGGVLERVLRGRSALLSTPTLPFGADRDALLRAEDELLLLGAHGLAARGRHADICTTPSSYRVVVLRHTEAFTELLGAAGYNVQPPHAADARGLVVADPTGRGTRPLIAASLSADAPLVELYPLRHESHIDAPPAHRGE
jgi:ABC-type uncharacterized transport system ATPase subunit